MSPYRIIKAKRSIQSNQDKTSSQGKLQLSGGLFSSTVTEAEGKKDESKPSGGLFSFSTKATEGGASNSLFGGSSLFGGTSGGFKFQPSAITGASLTSGGSLFGGSAPGASLFGGPSLFSQAPKSEGGLFGNSTGGGLLFNNMTKPLFEGADTRLPFMTFKKAEGDENEDDEEGDNEPLQDEDEPPAFQPGDDQSKNFIPGVTDKPVQLKIDSKPPAKSPYTKIFNVSHIISYH